jgi:hypothetical protein
MSSQTEPTTHVDEEYDRRSARHEWRMARRSLRSNSITGGVFLIGLGMLVLTNWWWPGIMLVIGAAAAAEMVRRGNLAAAATTFIGFAAIPLGIALLSAINIPWLPVGAFVLIALGLLSLARATGSEQS